MSKFSLDAISTEDQDDLRAEARSEMFFALRGAFSKRQKQCGIKAKDLSDILGKDKSYVSRVLNGTQDSIDYETLCVFMHALGYHLPLAPVSFEDLARRKKNFDIRPHRSVEDVSQTKDMYIARFKVEKPQQGCPASLRVKTRAARVRNISKPQASY